LEHAGTTLYHCTWSSNVPGIIVNGLVPNCNPNRWTSKSAIERSKGKNFLCDGFRRLYWTMTYEEGWAGRPDGPDVVLVWLEIDTTGLSLHPDDDEDNFGDFWTTAVVSPDKIHVI
jgi:hypothetical protein